jgi:hypothetical protein
MCFVWISEQTAIISLYSVKIKPRIAMAKANSFHQQTEFKFKAETSKGLHLEHSCVVLKRGHFRKVDQKYLESLAMWCWRRMEKISWTDRVGNEEVLHRVKEERNILHTVKRRKATWIGHVLRRDCLLKHVIEGKIERRTEVTGR